VVTIQWVVVGYSFAFGGGNSIFGDFSYGGLWAVSQYPTALYSTTIPHILYCIYQLMFAIITAAIVSGGVAERMRFGIFLIFILLWTTLVYDPVAHWVWSAYYITWEDGTQEMVFGWVRQLGAIDFAGGTVVHMTSGFSALVASVIVGPRPDVKLPKKKKPSNLPYVILGGALLWFGWFGFNSGSAVAASGLASLAFANTQIATAMGMCTWIVMDTIILGHATSEGSVSGAVVGLVAITPCAGFVHVQSSLAIGFISTVLVYGSVVLKAKYFPRYFPQVDDALDVFTCHGVGAVAGALLLGFFTSKDVNPGGADGVFFGNPIQLAYQLTGVVVTIIWSVVFTIIILLPLKLYFKTLAAPAEHTLNIGMDKIYHGSPANPEAEESTEEVSSQNHKTDGENKSEMDNSEKV